MVSAQYLRGGPGGGGGILGGGNEDLYPPLMSGKLKIARSAIWHWRNIKILGSHRSDLKINRRGGWLVSSSPPMKHKAHHYER